MLKIKWEQQIQNPPKGIWETL